MALWMILHKGGPWETGRMFRDVGDGEMEAVTPVKDKHGNIVGEDRSNILIDAETVRPWAVDMAGSAGARVPNPFTYDSALGNAVLKPVVKRDVKILLPDDYAGLADED